MSSNIEKSLSAEHIREIAKFIRENRKNTEPFDIMYYGEIGRKSKSEAADIVGPFIEAGATWWNEAPPPWRTTFDEVRARIAGGPPKM